MRAVSILLIVCGLAVGGATAYIAANREPVNTGVAPPSGEFISGPQVGDKMPGTFEPLNINGPDAGDECCIFCKYGNNPVVMVFASKPSDKLAELVGKIEKAASEAKGEVGACLIVTETSDATKASLKKLADKQNFKHVVLAVIDAPKMKRYALHPDAELTVLLYSKQVVRENRALKNGELTDKEVEEISAKTREHFAAK
jgi:hypothetical protein